MTGLRTYAGVDLARIHSRFGFDLLAANSALIERLGIARLLKVERDRLVPTLEGLALADGLAAQFEIELLDAQPR